MIVGPGYDTHTTWTLTWGGAPTAILIDADAPEVCTASIRLRWKVNGEALNGTVLRNQSGNWLVIGDVERDGLGYMNFEDRDVKGQGFTHKIGDIVSVAAPGLGCLTNRMVLTSDAPPWTFGASHLMRSLVRRGALR